MKIETTIKVGELLSVYLKKDNEIVKSWEYPILNTYTTTGRNYLRDKTTDPGSKYPIGSIGCNGTGASTISSTESNDLNSVAVATGTFPGSGSITGVTEFRLISSNGNTYSTSAVSSFTKPDGFELEVIWRSTISGWQPSGRRYLMNMLTGASDLPYSSLNAVGHMELDIGGGRTVTTTNSKPADYQGQYLGNFGYSGSVGTLINLESWVLFDGGYGIYSSSTMPTGFTMPTNATLQVTWTTTFG
jgi:hypothetical protein